MHSCINLLIFSIKCPTSIPFFFASLYFSFYLYYLATFCFIYTSKAVMHLQNRKKNSRMKNITKVLNQQIRYVTRKPFNPEIMC